MIPRNGPGQPECNLLIDDQVFEGRAGAPVHHAGNGREVEVAQVGMTLTNNPLVFFPYSAPPFHEVKTP